MTFKKVLSTFFIFMAAHLGQTQELTPPAAPPFQLVEKAGEPVRLVFADGRVATLMASDNPVTVYKGVFQVTENLCRPGVKAPKCHYEMPYKADAMNFLWTTHPEAGRLGQKIKVLSNPNAPTELLDDALFIANFLKVIKPSLGVSMPPDQIVCDHYDWLPENARQNLHIKLWSGELMTTNFESDVNENQAFFSYSGVQFERKDGALVFKTYRRINSSVGLPPLTDTSMAVIDDGAGGCQISIGSSLQQLTPLLRPSGFPLVRPAPLFGSFALTAPILNSEIKSYIQNASYYKPEMFQ